MKSHYSSSHFLHLLTVKTRNGARYTAMTKDLAAKRARCEQIKNIISDQRNKVDECTTIISKNLHGKFFRCIFSSSHKNITSQLIQLIVLLFNL
jgi:hypothetical protein